MPEARRDIKPTPPTENTFETGLFYLLFSVFIINSLIFSGNIFCVKNILFKILEQTQ